MYDLPQSRSLRAEAQRAFEHADRAAVRLIRLANIWRLIALAEGAVILALIAWVTR